MSATERERAVVCVSQALTWVGRRLWFYHPKWDEMGQGEHVARLCGLHYCFDGPPAWYLQLQLRLEGMKMRSEERQAERDKLFNVW